MVGLKNNKHLGMLGPSTPRKEDMGTDAEKWGELDQRRIK